MAAEKSASIAVLRGYASRIGRDAAPVPAPRSRNVNASSSANGSRAAISRRRAPSARSRVLASAAQVCAIPSACQIAALISSGLSMLSRLLAVHWLLLRWLASRGAAWRPAGPAHRSDLAGQPACVGQRPAEQEFDLGVG